LLLLQGHEAIEDLRLDRDIERARRLIEDDQFGMQAQGAGERESLPPAPGEFVGVLLQGALGEADHRQERRDSVFQLGLRDPRNLGPHRFPDDLPDPHPWIEGSHGILEHDLDLPAQGAQRTAAQPRDVLPLEQNSPGRRIMEPRDKPSERRLSGAAFADQAQRLPRRHLERHPVDRVNREARAAADDVSDLPRQREEFRHLFGLEEQRHHLRRTTSSE